MEEKKQLDASVTVRKISKEEFDELPKLPLEEPSNEEKGE